MKYSSSSKSDFKLANMREKQHRSTMKHHVPKTPYIFHLIQTQFLASKFVLIWQIPHKSRQMTLMRWMRSPNKVPDEAKFYMSPYQDTCIRRATNLSFHRPIALPTIKIYSNNHPMRAGLVTGTDLLTITFRFKCASHTNL